MLVGLVPGIAPESQFARRLAESGVRVVVPMLIDRADTYSVTRAGRGTNFTTYCAGPRGERHEVASMRPELILWGAYYLVMGPAAALITYFRTSRP